MEKEASRGNAASKSGVYRYSVGSNIRTAIAIGFLGLPIASSMLFAVLRPSWSLDVFDPISAGLIALAMTTTAIASYLVLSRHLLVLDGHELKLSGLLGSRRVELQLVKEIAPFSTRSGRFLRLLDGEGHLLVDIGDDYACSEALWDDIKRRTRSPDVRLFKRDVVWLERSNLENAEWRASQGPTPDKDVMRRSVRLLIGGAALIALAYWISG